MLMVVRYFFKESLTYTGVARGYRCSSTKEAEAMTILFALKNAKEYGLEKYLYFV